MSSAEPLLTLAHADGTAAILREADGSLWLTGYVERGGGTGLMDLQASIEGLSQDRMVQGGRLPARAVRAELIDTAGRKSDAVAGGGVWLAVLDRPLDGPAPVRFSDAEGRSVRPPLPAAWSREPVPDAVEPCPACGETSWEEITPTDGSRGMHGTGDHDMRPSYVVVCVACGHEEGSGAWITMSYDDAGSPAEHEARRAAWQAERWEHDRKLLERVAIPVYVLASWSGPRTLAAYGGPERRVTSISVMHGDDEDATLPWVRVAHDTAESRWEGAEVVARHDLCRLVEAADEWPLERSRPALTVWLKHREREAMRIASRAEATTIQISIDGIEHRAAVVQHRPWLAAVIDGPVGRITIDSHDVAPAELDLVTLADPATALAPR